VIARRKIILAALISLLVLLPLGTYLTVGGTRGIERLILSQYSDIIGDLRKVLMDLNQDVTGIGSAKNLPLLKLSLSRKDVAHFSELIPSASSDRGSSTQGSDGIGIRRD
jgi:hypothetical protein